MLEKVPPSVHALRTWTVLQDEMLGFYWLLLTRNGTSCPPGLDPLFTLPTELNNSQPAADGYDWHNHISGKDMAW